MTNNSASRIQRAIVKLQELLDSSTPGPWEVDMNAPFSSDLVGLFSESARGYAVKFDDWEQPARPTADLIVTLHRTIEAQLAILQHGFEAYSWWDRHDEPLALALANAILKEDR